MRVKHMNFAVDYTPEQEQFRARVRAWLAEKAPKDLKEPADPAHLTFEQYQMQRRLGRALAGEGWLYPTFPKEYGGGGLDMDQTMILEEELDRYQLTIPPYYDSGGRLGAATILVWGSEEQKWRFLPPILQGEVRTWQLLTEPEAGSDLANVKTRAIRDGDSYVLNGQKIFVGSHHGADYSWMIACTDPDGERHQNLSWFMVPMDLPGISVAPMDLLFTGGERGAASGVKNTVYFENVRVPAFNLVGGENQGWKVASTHLELEHGLIQSSVGANRFLERLLKHCKETKRLGQPLTQDPDVRDLLVDIYIDAQISRLFALRNYWLRHANKPLSYEGSQYYLYNKVAGLKNSQAILQILGPYALTRDPQWTVEEGHIETQQRGGIVNLHPGGTVEIQKVIMARRLGIGRATREQAGALR